MKISIIGTGYVGLVSGTCFADSGNTVICVDNDQNKLAKLNKSELTIYEPGLEILFKHNIKQRRLTFTDDLKYSVLNSEIIFLCLPTPQDEDGSADLSYVLGVAGKIGTILKEADKNDYKIIVNKSTVPVGTAKKVKDILLNQGADNFDVVSNPEFLREGYAVEDFQKPDRIVIGSESKKALELMKQVYESFVRQGNPILEMDTKSAEVTKYAANAYLAMRITYMNELANFCEKVGANVDSVRKGMSTDTRIGKRFLFAGIGYGGSCFPKDVNALINTSTEKKSLIKILKVVDEVNKQQKLVLVDKILDYFGGDIKNKTLAIWGLAFKPNTDDMREAPAIPIINKLLELGAIIKVYDPGAMQTARHYFNDRIEYSATDYNTLLDAEALIILTEWNEFRNPDFNLIKSNLKHPVIFDGRNIYELEKMKLHRFIYYSIGRETIRNNDGL
jgi:UDPglucose 6-dehydrogenase